MKFIFRLTLVHCTMTGIYVLSAILIHFGLAIPLQAPNKTEIILTHVVLRHGERTTYKFYPNDPNINNTFFPIGPGGLTNKGKMMEFQLGKFLRKEYDSILGEHFYEGLLDARSTDTMRTKMSAQLVLAGLFPPSSQQTWHSELAWQPIPVFSRLKDEEDLLHPDCERKLWILNNLDKRPEIQKNYIKPFETLFNFVSEKSGMEIKNVHDLVEFYFIVNTEDDLNMTIPSWVHEIYPEPLYSTSSLIYSYFNFDEEVKRLNAGYLLKKMLDDSMAKINSDAKYKDMKMFLYSGHETTIGFFLHALRVLKNHIPPYGSAILLELHKDIENHYYIKLRYKSSPNTNFAQELSIPGCDVLCPIQQFIGLQKSLLPTKTVEEACRMVS